MARILRQIWTEPLPDGADVFEQADGRGKARRFARVRDKAGKLHAQRVTKRRADKPDRLVFESSLWYVEFSDTKGRPRRLPGYVDKAATAELGRRLDDLAAKRAQRMEPDAELRRWLEALPDPVKHKLVKWELLGGQAVGSARPLAEHVDDFERELQARERTAVHVQRTVNRIRRFLDDTGV